ncbi:MAG: hypothetical protein WBE68_15125, partial [Candidatus Nitrosopolaris sp.]
MKLDVFFNTPSFAIFSSERKTIALIVYFPSQLLYHTFSSLLTIPTIVTIPTLSYNSYDSHSAFEEPRGTRTVRNEPG